jgi:hypothetical protein
MTAGGRTHHADAVGLDAPLLGVGANGADGTAGVEKWDGILVSESCADPVFDDDCGVATRGEPICVIRALMAGGENGVSAAGENDYGCAVG